MAVNGTNISVQKTFYNDSQMTDMNSLANAMLSKPLSFLTEGVGNAKSIESLEYEYRVATHRLRTRPVAATMASTSNVGLGGATFELEFPDKHFVFPYVLVSQAGTQARIMKEPEAIGSGWKYTLQLVNPAATATVAAADVTAGALWAQMYAPLLLENLTTCLETQKIL